MPGTYDGGVVDGCVFHEWTNTRALAPYMTSGWRQLLLREGDRAGPSDVRANSRYPDPRGKRADAYPAEGRPGSNFELLKSQVLDAGERHRVVLGYDEALFASALPNFYIARVAVQAANDWTAEEWLSQDNRLYGMILISSALPAAAGAEIRRMGKNERMVAVALGVNGLDRPFGHPVFHPIYEAAVEMGLPVVIQTGCNSSSDGLALPVAGGLPATIAEYRALRGHAVVTHAVSMISQGVFELYPDLKVLLLGTGAAWVPAFLWGLDYRFKLDNLELTYLRRSPSDYFLRHVSIGTYGLETPRQPERLGQALGTVPHLEDNLIYSSCYPNSDSEEPSDTAKRLPESWRPGILQHNAMKFFRWPGTPAPASPSPDRAAVDIAERYERAGAAMSPPLPMGG